MSEIKSINAALNLADEIQDRGEDAACNAIRFCAGAADQRERWLEKLAWAAVEKNARKRREVLTIVLMERDANDESNARLPMRPL